MHGTLIYCVIGAALIVSITRLFHRPPVPMNAAEVADLIERFLNRQEKYPQEWNDFIESGRVVPQAEQFRKRCYELDPLVNIPGVPDENALAELREMVRSLRDL